MNHDRFGNFYWNAELKKNDYMQPPLDDIIQKLSSGKYILWGYSYDTFLVLSQGSTHLKIYFPTIEPAWKDGRIVEQYRRPSDTNRGPKGEKIFYKLSTTSQELTETNMSVEYERKKYYIDNSITEEQILEFIKDNGYVRVYYKNTYPSSSIHTGRRKIRGVCSWKNVPFDKVEKLITTGKVIQSHSEAYRTFGTNIQVRIYRVPVKVGG